MKEPQDTKKYPKSKGNLKTKLGQLQARGLFTKPKAKPPGPRTYGAGVD